MTAYRGSPKKVVGSAPSTPLFVNRSSNLIAHTALGYYIGEKCYNQDKKEAPLREIAACSAACRLQEVLWLQIRRIPGQYSGLTIQLNHARIWRKIDN